ncbi:MAG: polynucleotide adenylyltransferase, partial [Clostridiales bacterium]|nr:polynucleotide adenylyltransferase [Clostridiales bacterium]
MTFDTDYGAYIPDYCRKVLAILNDAGYEAYVVGGAVRDMIGGTEPADYDLATSAVPEE